jgi:hypothetical protein
MMRHLIGPVLCVGIFASFGLTVRAQQSDKSISVENCGPCPTVTNVLPVSFPMHSRAVSPDGRYVIVGVDSNSEPHHKVFLKDVVLKTRRKIFDYNRNIVLLWANDSKSFAVTDYVGSNTSQCSVFSVDETVRPIQLLDNLLPALSKPAREQLKRQLSSDHVYVEASAWTAPEVLTVKISGYGEANPKGFEQFYSVQLHPGEP